jgi:glyoxylase-like metal-dependent hydrolase (beta-lactamase superfamily II)
MEITRIINSVFTSNTFVLTEEEENYCWLVDVGDVGPIIDIVGNRELKGILLTHSHFDHIYGINKIIERFPNCVVYTSIDGKEGLYSDKYNFSRYHGESIIFQGENIHVFTDGE